MSEEKPIEPTKEKKKETKDDTKIKKVEIKGDGKHFHRSDEKY